MTYHRREIAAALRYDAAMSCSLFLGRPVADALLENLRSDIKKLNPKLVIVQVGDDAVGAFEA